MVGQALSCNCLASIPEPLDLVRAGYLFKGLRRQMKPVMFRQSLRLVYS